MCSYIWEHMFPFMGTLQRSSGLVALLSAALLAGGAAAADRFDLDRGGQALLDQVNRKVNDLPALAPFADPNGDGVWDCENYAAEKRARLERAGVPAEDLALWRVVTTHGEAHAILVVSAVRRGRPVDLVLDNLSAWTVARQALPYTGWAPLQVDDRAAATPRPHRP